MGLNNENVPLRPWVVFDIETAPIPDVADYIDPPDLSDVTAPSNYKDEAKIADYIEREKVRRQEKHSRDCTAKAALDWNVGRVVALGWQTESCHEPSVVTCASEVEEAAALRLLWSVASTRRPIVGFNIRSFDLPFCIQRSRLLRVDVPRVSLARFDNHDLCDLFDVLTFSDTQTTKVMRHTLERFAKRFGVPHDDSIQGGDIPGLVAAGAWDQVAAHVRADVLTTAALAEQVGMLRRSLVAEMAL